MATLCIRMDDKTKTAFDEFCSAAGLTVSAAVNMFAKRVVRDNKIPFDIVGDANPTPQFLAAIKEAEAIEKNKDAKGYSSVDELFEELNN